MQILWALRFLFVNGDDDTTHFSGLLWGSTSEKARQCLACASARGTLPLSSPSPSFCRLFRSLPIILLLPMRTVEKSVLVKIRKWQKRSAKPRVGRPQGEEQQR